MTPESLISPIERYLKVIIVPEHPEIMDFHVKRKKGQGEWNFSGQYIPVIKISFFVDGTEQEFEDDIRSEIRTMKRFFGLNDRNLYIDWRFVIDGEWNSEWYR